MKTLFSLLLMGSFWFASAQTEEPLTILRENFDETTSLQGLEPELDFRHSDSGWTGSASLAGGELTSSTSSATFAALSIPIIGDHETRTVEARIRIPADADSISIGFSDAKAALTASNQNIFCTFFPDGTADLYAGAANTADGTFTRGNNGYSTVRFTLNADQDLMTIHAGANTADELVGSVAIPSGLYYRLINSLVITFAASDPTVGVRYLEMKTLSRPEPWNPDPATFTGTSTTISYSEDFEDDFQDALDALGAGDVINLNSGTYIINEMPTGRESANQVFLLLSKNNVLINGNGATLLFSSRNVMTKGIMDIYRCEKAKIINLTIDFEDSFLPYTLTEVKAVDGDTVYADHLEGIALNDVKYHTDSVSQIWGYAIDPSIDGRISEGTKVTYEPSLIDLSANSNNTDYKFNINGQEVEVGDRFVRLLRESGAPGFYAGFSSEITYNNLTFYAGTSTPFSGNFNNAINILDCTVDIKEGRALSMDADAVHMQSMRIGPWVQGNIFRGQADDAINFYTKYYTYSKNGSVITINEGPNLTIGVLSQIAPIQSGDRVVFIDVTSGALQAIYEVATYDVGTQEMTLTGNPTFSFANSRLAIMDMTGNFYIADNSLTNSRRFGIFLKASNGIVTRNYFEGLSNAAITFHNELGDYIEGDFSSNVFVADNAIYNCGFDSEYNSWIGTNDLPEWAGSISFFSRIINGGTITEPAREGHDGIYIINNSIGSWGVGKAVAVDNSKYVVIAHNINNGSGIGAGDIFEDTANTDSVIVDSASMQVWSDQGEGSSLPDEFEITNYPTTVNPDGSATVTIEYSSSELRHLIIEFQENGDDYTNHGYDRINVSGSGIIHVNLPITNDPATGSGYRFAGYLTKLDSGYAERISGTEDATASVTVSASALSDDVDITDHSATVEADGTGSVTIDYECSEQRDLIVEFQEYELDYTNHGFKRIPLDGAGTINVVLPITGNPPPGDDYRFATYLTTVGGTYANLITGAEDGTNEVPVTSSALPDSVVAVHYPTTVLAGDTATVTIEYTTNGSARDIVVDFQTDDGSVNHGYVNTLLIETSGTISLSVPITNDPATGSGYRFVVYLSTVEGGWQGKIGTEVTKTPVTVSTSALSDAIVDVMEYPASVQSGETVSVVVEYTTNGNPRDLVVDFQTNTGSQNYGYVNTLLTGTSGTVSIDIPLTNNLPIPTGSNYRFLVYLSTQNGGWGGKVGTEETEGSITVASGARIASEEDQEVLLDEVKTFEIYPNPIENGHLNINLGEDVITDSLEIFDLIGRLSFVMEEINQSEITIDVSAFERGIYIVRVSQEGKVESARFVIK
ncbi:Por secretion system C-terminal sorting domain-containing protein [Reichenbachiella faecimaris]|uniref:Por secretion system C-terminal sorting domain-containing protein n=1 Tax=Reichenbachiella faecimaris TaxID=692418 RepID=A0A1W2G942_REIFA|nr:T9SS type A sorting domain-containing protein [Reichenbachiella faecimaris]SMD32816.1 Por secretion system C-terminal sorting domain-containing protein [Reichenbachiella faecimaris]